MKTATKQGAGAAGRPLEVLVVESPEDVRRFDALLAAEHYLGPRRPAGDSLRQAVARGGEWVALLLWCSAARRLKPRDEWIGWDAAKRSTRLKLVAQNARFLVPGARREPNLASACLAAACRALPEQWRARKGYAPVLAETFTDPELFRGTCYKAAGWVEAGATAGFSRDTVDYYLDNEHPKRLWLKPLRPDAREVLRARVLPAGFEAGRTEPPERRLPLRERQAESLLDALCGVPDPRRSNRSFPIGPMLACVVMAVACGASDISAIVRFAKQLPQDQRKLLCLPRDKSRPALRKCPSYKAFYNLLKKLDLDLLAAALNAWFQAHLGAVPPALAMDGKFVGEVCGTLNLAVHGDGRTFASHPVPSKGRELKAGQAALAALPGDLGGALVTADALHAQRDTARAVVEAGGEYLLQVKANQRALRRQALHRLDRAPFLPARSPATGA
jgi:hypothetical protein